MIHRNLTPDEQAEQVKQVKHFESGMVVNPITIGPEAPLEAALAIMEQRNISGVPVVENGGLGGRNIGKLVGVLTNRDVRFATNMQQPISELMTHQNLITVRDGSTQDEAKRLLHANRIEKLLVVDENYHCVGLITVKDIEKAQLNPNAIKDSKGRLRCAAASTVGDKGYERSMRLIDAEVDLLVIDTAHGHNTQVAEVVRRLKKENSKVRIVAGNVATAAATRGVDRRGG